MPSVPKPSLVPPPAPAKFLAVIPARQQSQRFPNKLLHNVTPHQPLIALTYENARKLLAAGLFAKLVVATDSQTIAALINTLGGEVIMTSPACRNGSERVREALNNLSHAEATTPFTHVFNLQGDEPLLPLRALRALKAAALNPSLAQASVFTLMKPIDANRAQNPNAVKVVATEAQYAAYFSRAPIPYLRTPTAPSPYYQHIGIYVYKSDFLKKYTTLTPTVNEAAEQLEQLRILDHGYRIAVEKFIPRPNEIFWDINSPEDLRALQRHLAAS